MAMHKVFFMDTGSENRLVPQSLTTLRPEKIIRIASAVTEDYYRAANFKQTAESLLKSSPSTVKAAKAYAGYIEAYLFQTQIFLLNLDPKFTDDIQQLNRLKKLLQNRLAELGKIKAKKKK